jgi:ABC-2 type transport system permease protein
MWPPEVVGDAMRTVGHLVPHAWAMDGWNDLIFERRGLAGIGAELGVLTVWAVALLAVATWRLHRALTKP